MKVEVEAISPVKKKLTVTIEPDGLEKAQKAELEKIRRTTAIKGFRKGKAPLSIIEGRFGAQARAESVGRAIQDGYVEAITVEDLAVVNDPDVELQSGPDDKGLVFTAVVEVRPEVTVVGFDGMQVKREKLFTDPTEVDARLEQMRQQRADYTPAKEGVAASDGDMVVIDFKGSVDGDYFEGGTAENHPLMLGSGRMIPGFEEGIVGMKAGDQKTINVTFPEGYQSEELSGRDAAFEIKVHEVKVKELPELDDEFAKDVSGLESLEDFRAKLGEMVEGEIKSRIEREFRDRMIDALLEKHPFEVPQSLVERHQAHSMERLTNDLASRGMTPEQMGLDTEQFMEASRAGAERTVRWAFLFHALVDDAELEVTDADVEERIQAIADEDGRPYTAIQGFFSEGDRLESLKNNILETKLFNRVVEVAEVVEVSREELESEKGADE